MGGAQDDKSGVLKPHAEAEQVLRRAFQEAGWSVSIPQRRGESRQPDMVARRSGTTYAVEVKVGIEARTDRLIPLWSQACLQAMHVAGRRVPLAVVAVPRIPLKVAENILRFAGQYAPDAAVGVIDFTGFRLFRGPHLESLNAEEPARPSLAAHVPKESAQLFSDLNQWMMKVLLAPELPDALLSAPRGKYRNASQLARAANVSVMSAFRFVQQLQRDGYLHESSSYLQLVRRDALFQQWQSLSLRRPNEVPMRFLLRGSDPRAALRRMLDSGRACLGLFAAADALGFGFVKGVPPYVYVRSVSAVGLPGWKNLVPASPGETPDVILRQAPAAQSIFRGIVRPDGLAASDILQVWLDVSNHPSRGAEQAALIEKRVLKQVIHGGQNG